MGENNDHILKRFCITNCIPEIYYGNLGHRGQLRKRRGRHRHTGSISTHVMGRGNNHEVER